MTTAKFLNKTITIGDTKRNKKVEHRVQKEGHPNANEEGTCFFTFLIHGAIGQKVWQQEFVCSYISNLGVHLMTC